MIIPDNTIFKNVLIRHDGKFYPQIFLEEALFVK